jgi:hypothetical protein
VIVVLGHRIGWVLRGARREPVAADGRRRILGADPTQVALFGFAAVTGVVVGILIPLIG